MKMKITKAIATQISNKPKKDIIYKLINLDSSRRSGWAWAFSLNERLKDEFDNNTNVYIKIQTVYEKMIVETVSEHLTNEFKSLYDETKKKIECPCCLEIMKKDNLHISTCGHLTCEECYEKLQMKGTNWKYKECPTCRKRMYNKPEES